jgi:hypothetical protein
MATDLAPYANLRLLLPQPVAAPANFRSGVPAATGSWVIECFVKRQDGKEYDKPFDPVASIDPRRQILDGYITQWAVLPANTLWIAARSAFVWTTTGLAPAGLLPGANGRGILTVLEQLPTLTQPALQGEATIVGLSDPFGPGGIGAEVRSVLGDKIRLNFQLAA